MPTTHVLVTARTDRLLLANAIMGQFLTGVATRIFIVSLPTLAAALDTDILAISWAPVSYTHLTLPTIYSV